jgi:hypothetical protein
MQKSKNVTCPISSRGHFQNQNTSWASHMTFLRKTSCLYFFSSIKGFQNYNEYLLIFFTIIKGKGKFTYKIMKGKL